METEYGRAILRSWSENVNFSHATYSFRERASFLLLFVGSALVANPAIFVPAAWVVMGPVNHTSLFVEFVLATNLNGVTFLHRDTFG